MLPKSIQDLIKEFARLPGVGMKTAARLTFYLLTKPEQDRRQFGQAIEQLKTNLNQCQECFNVSETEVCKICQDNSRDKTLVCVAETPLDAVAIEKGDQYQGVYHILGGSISPVDGIGPDQLRIKELLDKLKAGNKIKEVILATNPDLEGEATALYLQKKIEELGNNQVKITRIAKGLPIGGDIEYADEITIKQAFINRQELTSDQD